MDFKEVFPMEKPIIGMIHLAGQDPVLRAVKEMEIYREQGVDGVIIEDYHAGPEYVEQTLDFIQKKEIDVGVVKGINILGDTPESFRLANKYGCNFIQADTIQPSHIRLSEYSAERRSFPNIAVLGGVRFKYQSVTGKSLEQDIAEALPLCDAIVTTGEGTGEETPLEKLVDFRRVMGDFPLIDGAGVNPLNAYEQLSVANGAIIGSSFKRDRDTQDIVQGYLIKRVMDEVRRVRADLE